MKRIGCVVMASGLGKRFGGDKLLAEFCGKSMIQHILDHSDDLFDSRVVVTRNIGVVEYCEEKKIPYIFHDFPDRSDTIRLGLEQMMEMDGCMFCPCDQPLLKRSSLERMIHMFEHGEKSIIRLGFEEKVGAPVLFHRRYFEQLRKLPLHNGGSYVMKQYPNEIQISPASSQWELFDVDTQEALRLLLEQAKQCPELLLE